MYSQVEDITPELAASILNGFNTANRPLSPSVVREYAGYLTSGRWATNGESIKFAQDGTLIDGQHRLAACVRAKTPLRTLVVRGLYRDVFDTVDIGKTRSAGDILAVMKTPDAAWCAKVLRLVMRLESGSVTAKDRVAKTQFADGIVRHTGIIQTVAFLKRSGWRNYSAVEWPGSGITYSASSTGKRQICFLQSSILARISVALTRY